MRWCVSNRADPAARRLADRHYSRQKIGTPQFVPTGSCCVFVTDCGRAFWVTSAPFPQFVKHAWPGAWVCTAFRSEGAGKASELIRQALAATLWHYAEPPAGGLITMIDRERVKPTMVRGVPVWGWTWVKAGFRQVGETKKNRLLVFHIAARDMPPAESAKPRAVHGLGLFDYAAGAL